jgi:urocanate hydratase
MYQELIHHIETSNIYDGSRFTADMAIQNVIGDSFRGATWVSIHNGGV